MIWFKRLLLGHFRTKTNLLLTENRLVRLPHRLIQLENKSPVQNTTYASRHYFLHPRTVCIIIYRAVILDFMKSSAILNHQALVNRKFILNLLQNGQIYNSSRKSVQQNTYYLGLLSKKKYTCPIMKATSRVRMETPRRKSIKKRISVRKWSHELTVSCTATTQHNVFKQL